ncbi:MAG: O-antigen ligase family protein [Alphaproteobacteria bacterium]|nr:O-antigen ligase family protein [Alphaproteobacteria bacterium]
MLGAIVILTAILLSHSRAGLLATALGLAALYLCRRWRDWCQRGEGRKDRRVGWGAAPLILALTLIAVVVISGAVTFKRADQEASLDAVGRVNIYDATLTAIADRPWLGHGLGSYRWVFEAYRTPTMLIGGIIDKAHNSYLEFAFEAGVPAFLVLMALYGRLFIRCLKGVRQRQQDTVYPAIAVAAATLLAAHSVVDFPLQIPAITIVFLFLFGIGFAQSWSSQTP